MEKPIFSIPDVFYVWTLLVAEQRYCVIYCALALALCDDTVFDDGSKKGSRSMAFVVEADQLEPRKHLQSPHGIVNGR